MRKFLVLLFLLVFVFKVEGAIPVRTYSYVSGNAISPSEVTTNEDNVLSYLAAGVEAIATNTVVTSHIVDGTILNADISSSAAIVGSKLDLSTPGAIGATSPSTGAFTTLSATGAITATGGQIVFPASQSASSNVNTLDDYEEGYYTATLTCGTSGTITVDSAKDQLAYTKIGRLVTVIGHINIDSVSSPVGDLRLNLPLTGTDLTEEAEGCAGSVAISAGTGNVEALVLVHTGGAATTISIQEQVGTGTTVATDVANHITTSTDIQFTFSYIVE